MRSPQGRRQAKSEATAPDSLSLSSFVVVLNPIPPFQEGASLEMQMAELIEHWPTLLKNVDRLTHLVKEAIDKAQNMDREGEERYNELEVQLATLRLFVGDRRDLKVGLSSLAQGVTDTLDLVNQKGVEIDKLSTWKQGIQAQLAVMIATSVQAELDTKVFGGEYHDLIIRPLTKLLFDMSTGPHMPGDLLIQWISDLEGKVQGVEAQMGATGPTNVFLSGQATAAPNPWGLRHDAIQIYL